ncbi:MAG: AAA family ATPase [Bacteriovoracales bacterium]|nr:AAA family ATPase [Bacteriovoracales bacterium]
MGYTLDQVFNFAVRRANEKHHEYLTLELILLGLLQDDFVTEILKLCGVELEAFKKELDEFLNNDDNFSILGKEQMESLSEMQFTDENIRQIAKNSGIFYQPELTMGLQRVLQRSAMHIQSSGKKEIHAVHLLVSMFDEEESHSVYLLKKYGVGKSEIIQIIAHGIDKATNTEDLAKHPKEFPTGDRIQGGRDALAEFTVHLNEKAKNGKIDPLIGREDELERIIQILCRRRKNNPLLVGDAGVGKTALAHGLALKVEQREVPEAVKGMQIYSLDMAALLAGTKYRGDFEARFKNLLKALDKKKNEGMAPLLFIDEIHTIMGAGAVAGGGADTSNLLRPSLSQGDLRCMGSTTYEEFRKFMDRDSALTRRFQKLEVKEPSEEESIKILMGLKESFERHHGVKFSPSVIKAAVRLSNKHISGRKLPDKAIDIIDEVGSLVQLQKKKRSQVTLGDIDHVVAQIARIPKQAVSGNEKTKIKNLDRDLKLLIFGQDYAVDSICRAVILGRSGLGRKNAPIASFLFAGPTGVGKTELARQLAHHLGIHIMRIDMSEYMEKHSVSKLIGAPPGYVGHNQGGILTEAINKNPHAVILLDEIEKAHPDIFNILLQVMDYGNLTDANGSAADCRNIILIMTTNAGAKDTESGSIGLGEKRQNNDYKRDKALKNFFTPEFRNRLDEIIHFNRLNEQMLDLIVDKFLNETKEALQEKNIDLSVTKRARQYLGEKGYDKKLGARPIRRFVENEINRPLSQEILFGKLQKGGRVQVDFDQNKLNFRYQED